MSSPALRKAVSAFLLVGRSPITNKNYQYVLDSLCQSLGPKRKVKRVRFEDLAEYIHDLQIGDEERKPLKVSSISTYIQTIKSFFEFCIRQEYIRVSPANDLMIQNDRPVPKSARAVTPEDARKMLEYARVTSKRNYAILIFLIASGCRAGGIASLKISDLDFENFRAVIHEKRNKWVYAHFGEHTVQALKDWLAVRPKTDHEFVFTSSEGRGHAALKPRGFGYIVASISEAAGCSRIYGPHAFRHSRAHSMAQRGVLPPVVQKTLNISSAEVVLNNYYPSDDETVAFNVRRFELASLQEPEKSANVIDLIAREG